MTSWTGFPRRAATGALLTAALGAAVVATAPTAMAAAPYPGCLAPIDGVEVCTLAAKGPINESIGQIEATEPGQTLSGVLLVLEQCVDGDCRVVAVTTGEGTAVHTDAVRQVPGGHFVTTASWVDDLGRQHYGVRTE